MFYKVIISLVTKCILILHFHVHLDCSSNAPLVEAFLEAGAEVNGVFDEHGTTPLLRAVYFGNTRIVRAIATYPGVILTTEVSEV